MIEIFQKTESPLFDPKVYNMPKTTWLHTDPFKHFYFHVLTEQTRAQFLIPSPSHVQKVIEKTVEKKTALVRDVLRLPEVLRSIAIVKLALVMFPYSLYSKWDCSLLRTHLWECLWSFQVEHNNSFQNTLAIRTGVLTIEVTAFFILQYIIVQYSISVNRNNSLNMHKQSWSKILPVTDEFYT